MVVGNSNASKPSSRDAASTRARQCVQVGRERGTGDRTGRGDDRRNHGISACRCAAKEFADRRVSFGDQCAVVEQQGRIQQHRDIERFDAQPGIDGKAHGVLERVAVAGTQRGEVRGLRNCQPGSGGRGQPNVGGPGAAAGVA
ncbi:hypothetical protein ATCCBAA256_16380, partial [Mycobacterium montefiorense]